MLLECLRYIGVLEFGLWEDAACWILIQLLGLEGWWGKWECFVNVCSFFFLFLRGALPVLVINMRCSAWLSGWQNSVWLRVWNKCNWMLRDVLSPEPDEHDGCLVWLRRQCPWILSSSYDPALHFCHCIFTAVSTWTVTCRFRSCEIKAAIKRNLDVQWWGCL